MIFHCTTCPLRSNFYLCWEYMPQNFILSSSGGEEHKSKLTRTLTKLWRQHCRKKRDRGLELLEIHPLFYYNISQIFSVFLTHESFVPLLLSAHIHTQKMTSSLRFTETIQVIQGEFLQVPLCLPQNFLHVLFFYSSMGGIIGLIHKTSTHTCMNISSSSLPLNWEIVYPLQTHI